MLARLHAPQAATSSQVMTMTKATAVRTTSLDVGNEASAASSLMVSVHPRPLAIVCKRRCAASVATALSSRGPSGDPFVLRRRRLTARRQKPAWRPTVTAKRRFTSVGSSAAIPMRPTPAVSPTDRSDRALRCPRPGGLMKRPQAPLTSFPWLVSSPWSQRWTARRLWVGLYLKAQLPAWIVAPDVRGHNWWPWWGSLCADASSLRADCNNGTAGERTSHSLKSSRSKK